MTALAFFLVLLLAVVVVPLVLLAIATTFALSLLAIPLKIAGALFRGFTKALVWLALLLVPLAVVATPLLIFGFFTWIVFRAVRGRRNTTIYATS